MTSQICIIIKQIVLQAVTISTILPEIAYYNTMSTEANYIHIQIQSFIYSHE